MCVCVCAGPRRALYRLGRARSQGSRPDMTPVGASCRSGRGDQSPGVGRLHRGGILGESPGDSHVEMSLFSVLNVKK